MLQFETLDNVHYNDFAIDYHYDYFLLNLPTCAYLLMLVFLNTLRFQHLTMAKISLVQIHVEIYHSLKWFCAKFELKLAQLH